MFNSNKCDVLPSQFSTNRRTVRADDAQLSSVIEKMQKLARLITGIAIQMGLMDGKISTDGLVSDLLQLGNVTATQIVAIDGSKLQLALASLKELPDKLKPDVSSTRAEEKLKVMNEVRLMVENVDVTKWGGKKAFEDLMKEVETNGVKLDKMMEVYKKASAWKAEFVKVEGLKPIANDQDMVTARSCIIEIKKISTELDGLLTDLTTNKPDPVVLNVTDSLKPVIDAVSVVKMTQANNDKIWIKKEDYEDFASYTDQLNRLSDASAAVAQVLPSLQIVRSIASTGRHSVGSSLDFSGFSNGFRDIQRIFSDLPDSWLSEVVASKVSAASLEPLKSLVPSFEHVDTALGGRGDEQQKKLEKMFKLVEKVLGAADSKQLNNTMEDYLKCSGVAVPTSPAVKETKNLTDTAAAMDTKVSELNRMIDFSLVLLKAEDVKKWLEATKTLAVDSKDPAVLQQTVYQLKQSEDVKNLSKVIEQVLGITESQRQKVKDIKQDAGVILSETNKVDDFQKSLSNHPALFQCLSQMDKKNAERTANAMTLAQKFRTMQPDVVTDGEGVVGGVTRSAKELKALKSALMAMKGRSSSEADVFKSLPNAQKQSRIIGSATRGIHSMKMALDRKSQAEVVMQSSKTIEALLSNSTIDPTDRQLLEEVVRLNATLETMYFMLGEWKTGVLKTTTPELQNFAGIFTSAKTVPGVNGDLEAMSEAVGRLAPSATDPNSKSLLLEAKKALDTLHLIDLNFAAHTIAFDGAEKTLVVLATFFGKPSNRQLEAVKSWFWRYLWAIIIGGASVIFVACGGAGVWWKTNSDAKKKQKKKSEESGTEATATASNQVTQGAVNHPLVKNGEWTNGKPNMEDIPGTPEYKWKHSRHKGRAVESYADLTEYTAREPTVRDILPVDCDAAKYGELTRHLDADFVSHRNNQELERLRDATQEERTRSNGAEIVQFCNRIADGTNPNRALFPIDSRDYPGSRNAMYLTEATRVKLPVHFGISLRAYINANKVTLQNGLEMILTQWPLRTECVRIYWMMFHEKSKIIVNFGKPDDDYMYFPRDSNRKLSFPPVTVTLKAREATGKLIIRTLKVEVQHREPFMVTLYDLDVDMFQGRMADAHAVIDLLNRIRTIPDPIVVVCKDGLGPSAAFAYIEMCQQAVCRSETGVLEPKTVLTRLRQQRHNALHKEYLPFCFYTIIHYCRYDRDEPQTQYEIAYPYLPFRSPPP